MHVWHQKEVIDNNFPFALHKTDSLQFPAHWHDEIEIVYVIGGNATIGVNAQIYHLFERDILVVGSGSVHHYHMDADEGNICIMNMGLQLFGNFAERVYSRRFCSPLIKAGVTDDNQAHNLVEPIILDIMFEHQTNDTWQRLALRAKVISLIVQLLRTIPNNEYDTRELYRNTGRLDRLERIFKFVDENYQQEIQLEDVARIAHYSKYHFTRFFKEATGMSFINYLCNYRLSKAQWLLMHTDDSITKIANDSGFNSIKTFNRIYKTKNGRPPSQMRK